MQGELDAVEQKQQFDAQLLKANTDAAEFKAMYDKVSAGERRAACIQFLGGGGWALSGALRPAKTHNLCPQLFKNGEYVHTIMQEVHRRAHAAVVQLSAHIDSPSAC